MMRNVFLTGGSRGIGAAAVLALARAGYNVAFTYHAHPKAAEAVAAQARWNHGDHVGTHGRIHMGIFQDAGLNHGSGP